MKSDNATITMRIEELNEMKANEQLMKQSVRNMTAQLEETAGMLKTTKQQLSAVSKELHETRLLLHTSMEMQAKAEETAERCVREMSKYLSWWLTDENKARVDTMLKYYHPLERVKIINALLTYLVFGKKTRLEREVEKTHFNIICEKIDEDSITLPTHSMMVKLMQKYGLFKALKG